MGEGRNVCRVPVGKPEGKRPLERPRRRWEDGIKMDLREIAWGVWIGFTWLRIGIVGGLLWMRWWTFGFWRHGVSWLVNHILRYLRKKKEQSCILLRKWRPCELLSYQVAANVYLSDPNLLSANGECFNARVVVVLGMWLASRNKHLLSAAVGVLAAQAQWTSRCWCQIYIVVTYRWEIVPAVLVAAVAPRGLHTCRTCFYIVLYFLASAWLFS
jgi:hypothetical protein